MPGFQRRSGGLQALLGRTLPCLGGRLRSWYEQKSPTPTGPHYLQQSYSFALDLESKLCTRNEILPLPPQI